MVMELGQLTRLTSYPGHKNCCMARRSDQFVNQIANNSEPVRTNSLMKILLVINHFVRVLNEYVGEGPSLAVPEDNQLKRSNFLGTVGRRAQQIRKEKKIITWVSLKYVLTCKFPYAYNRLRQSNLKSSHIASRKWCGE